MSSNQSISQTLLTPPGKIESQSTDGLVAHDIDQALSHIRLEHNIERSLRNCHKEIHLKRLQSLRKELEFLSSTDWQFEDRDRGTSQY